MKFNIGILDCPWSFNDKLEMSNVKRGADAVYNGTLKDADLLSLDINGLMADDALLAVWSTGAHVQLALDCIKAWKFKQKQVWVWVKTKKDINELIAKKLSKLAKDNNVTDLKSLLKLVKEAELIDLNDYLSFGMGHVFRQTHEIAFICARGKILSHIKNKSQISVHMNPLVKHDGDDSAHSAKPEGLQDRLDLMFPDVPKVELFARRDRPGWVCAGNECPSSMGEDIRDSIKRLRAL